MSELSERNDVGVDPTDLPDFVRAELQTMTSTERAAV